MGGPTGSIRYCQYSSRDHLTTQDPPLRQSRDTFRGVYMWYNIIKLYCHTQLSIYYKYSFYFWLNVSARIQRAIFRLVFGVVCMYSWKLFGFEMWYSLESTGNFDLPVFWKSVTLFESNGFEEKILHFFVNSLQNVLIKLQYNRSQNTLHIRCHHPPWCRNM
jgi:hypothetical protein